MLGYIVWLISFKVADAVVGTVLGSCRDSTYSSRLLKMYTYLFFFILKILTDFRKTVETGMDPRLLITKSSIKMKMKLLHDSLFNVRGELAINIKHLCPEHKHIQYPKY